MISVFAAAPFAALTLAALIWPDIQTEMTQRSVMGGDPLTVMCLLTCLGPLLALCLLPSLLLYLISHADALHAFYRRTTTMSTRSVTAQDPGGEWPSHKVLGPAADYHSQ